MDTIKSYRVEFIGDRSIKVNQGESILNASLSAGIPHYHACGGNGKCSTCRVLIKEGMQNLTPYTEKEKLLRKRMRIPQNVRLACQTFVVRSPVLLHRIIRDETDIKLYIKEDTKSDVQNIGEEKDLALFFLDIRNFTLFMEASLAFDVIHVIRRLFTMFRRCIEECYGRIIETSGDGFYAVFGIDSTIEKAVNDAYSAGLLILNELDKFNINYLRKYFKHEFRVGIGLHMGKVIIGNIGIGVNNNLTVMGMPVNIASRIQTATKEMNNDFLISHNIYEILRQPPQTDEIQIALKGVKNLMKVFRCGKAYSK
jgi:adenylate cyclase